MWRFRVAHRLRSALWPIPLLCVAAGIGLALATLAVDRRHGYRLAASLAGSPSGVHAVLSTFATALVTLTGVVLSVTLVALQLAMGQFSPRIVRALLEDRGTQVVVGLFGATFVQSVLTLRVVDDTHGPGRVPGLSACVAYGLMLASMAALVLFVHHAGASLRVSGVIELVGDRTRGTIDRLYPPTTAGDGAGDPRVATAQRCGVVLKIHHDALVHAASRAGCVLEVLPAMGDFVPAGAGLVRVHGDPDRVPGGIGRLDRLVLLGPGRTHEDDPVFGLRKLVDIAERAIAQPFNDPTTTVGAIDRLHDCLRQLATRPFPSGRFCDDRGAVRLLVPTVGWDGYVRLAFDELRRAGACSPQVTRRLLAVLDDLSTVAPPERRPALEHQRRLIALAVRHNAEQDDDARGALVPDPQGIGSGTDVIVGREMPPGGGACR